MRQLDVIRQNPRIHIIREGSDGLWADFIIPSMKPGRMFIIASWGGGWEHVSLSHRSRCPSWDEMNLTKEIFWDDEECVVQFHPPKSEYVNCHPFCLHLWKKIGSEFETPPKGFVG